MTQARQQGITLLEVLVAFSILALSMGVLLQIFASGSRIAQRSEDYSKALLIAESRMAWADSLEGHAQSHSGSDAERYRWQLTVEPYVMGVDTPANVGANLLFQIRVQVSWDRGDGVGTGSVQLSSLRLLQTS